MAMTKQPSLHENDAGVGRLLGPQIYNVWTIRTVPIQNIQKAVRRRKARHTGEIKPPLPAPAELFTSPKLDSTFLYLLNLITLVREGQIGGAGWDLWMRSVQKGV